MTAQLKRGDKVKAALDATFLGGSIDPDETAWVVLAHDVIEWLVEVPLDDIVRVAPPEPVWLDGATIRVRSEFDQSTRPCHRYAGRWYTFYGVPLGDSAISRAWAEGRVTRLVPEADK